MEHRYGSRTAINVKATAKLADGNEVQAHISNVSLSGIRAEVDTESLVVHTPIKFYFHISHGNKMHIYRWRGFVTRLDEQGVGAIFDSTNPDEQAGLLALLNAAEPNSHAMSAHAWYW